MLPSFAREKGILRTAGSKPIFGDFCLATKVTRAGARNLLGLDLAVLAISPIAAPVSDGYLATFGWIAIVLIAASAISWSLGRK